MTIAISVNPGQTAIIAVQTLDGYGQREDGYIPQVDFVLDPSGEQLIGYPVAMSAIATGLYNSAIVIPTGITAVGTYLASVSYINIEGYVTSEIFLIHAARPFGAATVSPA